MMSSQTASRTDYLNPADSDDPLIAGVPGGAGDTFSVVDQHSSFDGMFQSDRDLRIEGDVKGTIECQGTLFVAQGATVTAKVLAENISVAGNLSGDIVCRGRLHMMPSGRVRGKISTETLVINEGAYYEGQLEMAAPEDRNKRPPTSLPGAAGGSSTSSTPTSESRGSADRGASSTTFIRRLGGPETAWDTGNRSDDEPPSESE